MLLPTGIASSPQKLVSLIRYCPGKTHTWNPSTANPGTNFYRRKIFTTLLEAKVMAEDYLHEHSHDRIYTTLGYMTPHEFKQNWNDNKPELATVRLTNGGHVTRVRRQATFKYLLGYGLMGWFHIVSPKLLRRRILMRIGMYIGSWPQNIGNAFFDLGAKAVIRESFPGAEIFPMGGAVHWMFNASRRKREGRYVTRARHAIKKPYLNGNSIEIGESADVDLIVFAGMSLCEEFVVNNGQTLEAAADRGVRILGLGVGASQYSNREASVFSEFFERLGSAALVTRDEDTFNMFSNRLPLVTSGIDSAFFLPEAYVPPSLTLPEFEVENFDASPAPTQINHHGRLVINTHHDLWGPLPRRYTNKPNTLVSDVPEDYLTLYANTKRTYSDRVHACVATLTYGNEARLYSVSPRQSLFRRVGLEAVANKVTSANLDDLRVFKDNHILATKRIVEELF